MSRRNKPSKPDKHLQKHHSLNPEFDEANQQILSDLSKKKDYLICDVCGTEYTWDVHNKPGMYCSQQYRTKSGTAYCQGRIWRDSMISLPDSVKIGKSSWKGSGSTSYATTWESHKHYGDKVIFEYEGKQLFASNSSSLDEKSGKWNLIIDLAGIVTMPRNASFIREDAKPQFKSLSKHLDKDEALPSDVLRLFWNDMSIPPCGIEFWVEMWKVLPEKTVIGCMGGHGRTGTCIASLIIASGQMDYWQALEHVRKEHCKKAVENLVQEQYLHAIYMELLNWRMNDAKKKNDLTMIKDVTEDIAFALKNKPVSFQGTGYTTQSKADFKGNDDVVVGKIDNKGGASSVGIPFSETIAGSIGATGSSEGKVEWDPNWECNVKTLGDRIYVEECINKLCIVPDCKEQSHMGWVEWDFRGDM